MRTSLLITLLATLTLTLLACKGDKAADKKDGAEKPAAAQEAPAGDAAHCDAIADTSICVEFKSMDAAKAECESKYKGKVAAGACPADQLSGACAYGEVTRKYYKAGASPQAPAYAQKHCEKAMKGTFTAAP